MKIHFSGIKVKGIVLVIMLTGLTQFMCFCQSKQNPGQKPQEKTQTPDPPGNSDNQGRRNPPSAEEKLNKLQEKIIKPLALNSTQSEAVIKAYKEFYTGMENLRKAQSNQQDRLDKSKVQPLKKTRDDQIRKVLTNEQFVKYQELEKSSRPQKPN
ncbi:MAG: hypothetical protein NTW16_13325 [Bacteroidetes bacterium]|nr:hypothetical protein [Bacteroidota bacterium]